MIATLRPVTGKERPVRVIRPVGDGYYYLVDHLDGRPPLLRRHDRLTVAGKALKGPKAAA